MVRGVSDEAGPFPGNSEAICKEVQLHSRLYPESDGGHVLAGLASYWKDVPMSYTGLEAGEHPGVSMSTVGSKNPALEKTGRHFLVLLVSPDYGTDLDRHIEKIVSITDLQHWDVRQKFLRHGITSLMISDTEDDLQRISHALKTAGYQSTVLDEGIIKQQPLPRRAVAVESSDSSIAFLDRNGQMILGLGKNSRYIIVVGDLAHESISLAKLQQRAKAGVLADGELLTEPVLRIFVEREETGVLIVGNRFNYGSMGSKAGISVGVNFRHMVTTLQKLGADVVLEDGFGFADQLPITVTSAEWVGQRLAAFEVHARVAKVLWSRGLALARAPAVQEHPVQGPPPIEQAPLQEPLSLYKRSTDFAQQIGPLKLVLPLIATALLFTALLGAVPILQAPLAMNIGVLGLLWAHTNWRRKRAIEDFPTSKVRSLAMGKVEVIGRAAQMLELRAPFSQVDCVWYRAELQRKMPMQDGSHRWRRVRTIHSGDLPFYLEDDTGRILVDPVHANININTRQIIHPAVASADGLLAAGMSSDMRCVESYIAVGSTLYVMGTAMPMRSTEGQDREELLKRLRRLKQDKAALAEFDADGNGRIDEDEWAMAVAATRQDLLKDSLLRKQVRDRTVIGKGGKESLFIIADHDERHLLWSLTLRVWLGIILGFSSILVGVFLTLYLVRLA